MQPVGIGYALGDDSQELLKPPIVTDPQTGERFYAEPAVEPFTVALLANQERRDLSQFFGRDCAFLWTGLAGNSTGVYQTQFIIPPDNRLLSTAPVNNVNMVGTAQFPVPIWPAIKVPPGSRIGIYLLDTSGAGNTVQLVFYGVRLFRVR